MNVISFQVEAQYYEQGFENGVIPSEFFVIGQPVTVETDRARDGQYGIKSELIAEAVSVLDSHSQLDFRGASGIPRFLDMNAEWWYSFDVFIPEEYGPDPNSGEIIQQVHGFPDPGEDWREPPFSISIAFGAQQFSFDYASTDQPLLDDPMNLDRGRVTSGSVNTGHWHSFVVNLFLDYETGGNGRIKVWVDNDDGNGYQVLLDRIGPVGYNDQNGHYFLMGLYKHKWRFDRGGVANAKKSRDAGIDKRTLYFDNVKITKGANKYDEVARNTGQSSNGNAAPVITNIPLQTIEKDQVMGPINLIINDEDTSPDDLSIRIWSINKSLVKNKKIILGGSGNNRTLTITPEPGATGLGSIGIEVNDGFSISREEFLLSVVEPGSGGTTNNSPPSIGSLNDQTIDQDQSAGPLSFSVADVETPLGSLDVSAWSSNTALVPDGNITLTGSGGDRTVVVTPALGAFGTTTITVQVSDGADDAQESFQLTVREAVNNPPTISSISDQSIDQDQVLGPIDFAINDSETPVDNLVIKKWSSNNTLVPNENVVIGGSGEDRTVVVTPALGETGNAVISIEVDDGNNKVRSEFNLEVIELTNKLPTISTFEDRSISQDEVLGPISFVIGDVETAIDDLVIKQWSSNEALVPNDSLVAQGNGADRNLTITPTTGEYGSTVISVEVDDGTDKVRSEFNLEVIAAITNSDSTGNENPTISTIGDQTIDQDQTLGPVSFTINDAETIPDDLVISAWAYNNTLVRNEDIVVEGTGTDRTLMVTPLGGKYGSTTITIQISDSIEVVRESFQLEVLEVIPLNSAPTISAIADQSIDQDQVLGPVNFTIDDAETSAADLTIKKWSSNEALVANENVVIGGSETNRTVTITPAAGQWGTALVSIEVSDGTDKAQEDFTVTVQEVVQNDPPTMSNIGNQIIANDKILGPISFTVDDAETPADELLITNWSSNTEVVQNSGIVVAGNGTDRTLTVTPVAGSVGTTTISIKVTDGVNNTLKSFQLDVQEPVNSLPTISEISNTTINQNQVLGPIDFTIGDLETPSNELVVNAWTSNTDLIDDVSISGTDADRTITVTPATDAIGSASITIEVSDGTDKVRESFSVTVKAKSGSSPFSLSTTFDDISCNGASDGSATLGINGGKAPYNILWSNGSTSIRASDLPPGTVSVTVTDSEGSSATESVTISEPDALAVTGKIIGETCKGKDGSIEVAVSGGKPPYQYQWGSGANGAKITGLKSGTYTVLITDKNNCLIEASYTLTSDNFNVSANIEDASCQSDNGSISLSVSGNGAPYSFAWSTGSTSSTINNLSEGPYQVIVTDVEGCSKTLNYLVETLAEATTFEMDVALTNATCVGNDGAISVDVTSGNGPFTFAWSNGATTNDISGLAAGDYSVRIENKYGCHMEELFTINNDPGPGKPDVIQIGDTLIVDPAYVAYQWYKNEVLIEGAAEQRLVITETNNYFVTVFDQNGCSAASDTYAATYDATATPKPEDAPRFNSILTSVDVYPNPASDRVNINIYVSKPSQTVLAIYDLKGYQISERDLGIVSSKINKSLDVSDLPTGLYMVKVKAGNELLMRRFIKN